MANHRSLAVAAIAAVTLALVFGPAFQPHIARADIVDDLNNQAGGIGNPGQPKIDAANGQQTNPGTVSGPSSDSSSSSTDTSAAATTTGTPVAGVGTAVVPPATPLIVDSYTADPALLQSGCRFTLTLKIQNPGVNDAKSVVVQIGPSAQSGYGSKDELIVVDSGNAKYVDTIAAGQSNESASFNLMANPSLLGGVRSIPVKITWQSNGYEYTASQMVGLLVNSYVSLDTTIGPTGIPAMKVPFPVAIRIKNTTSRPLKGVCVLFSGKGARPSSAATVTVGDIPGNATKTARMTYTAPLVGRAQLLATVLYTDDFDGQRTVQVKGWARVQRSLPVKHDDSAVLQWFASLFIAMFGLGGVS